jgi:hypothetical protein
MSTLSSLAARVQQLAVGTARPDRNALAAERDRLLAAPPPRPAGGAFAFPARPADRCRCADCAQRETTEDEVRVRYSTWTHRVQTLEARLFRLTHGNADPDETRDERDEPGRALARLRADLLSAIDSVRGRSWERVIEFDGRGRPAKAWETTGALADILRELIQLYRGTEAMVYLGGAELVATIERARDRMGALLVRPVEAPLDPALAARAGTQPGERSEAEELGLTPAPSPNILDGPVRFSRRGRA